MTHYVLAVDSYEAEATSREQKLITSPLNFQDSIELYAIIAVDESGAHIVDDGYRSRSEALEAWPEAK